MLNKSPQITGMHWLCYLGHSFTYQRSPQLAKIDGSSGEAPSLVGGQTLTDSTHQVDPWALPDLYVIVQTSNFYHNSPQMISSLRLLCETNSLPALICVNTATQKLVTLLYTR